MNYTETTQYLFSALPNYQKQGAVAYKPGLERIQAFCDALSNPEQKLRIIHVAGTNGKGSTSHMLASILQAAGYKTALFTSPHLRDFRERIRIDGQMISEQQVVDFVEHNRPMMERLHLSFFEMTAAMALWHFAEQGAEVAVIETGLGGRLDATNLVDPILSIITNIALEHTSMLGTTHAAIAAEKAGIIKPSRPALLGEPNPLYNMVFESRAEQVDAPLHYATQFFGVVKQSSDSNFQTFRVAHLHDGSILELQLDLQGGYQRHNILTVLAAVEILKNECKLEISEESLRAGLRSVCATTGLQGRWQKLGDQPFMVCDTAHNLAGLECVSEQLSKCKYQKLYCVMGFASDKDVRSMLGVMPADATYILTAPGIERAMKIETAAEIAKELGINYLTSPTVQDAIALARSLAAADDMVYVGGSNFVVAEI